MTDRALVAQDRLDLFLENDRFLAVDLHHIDRLLGAEQPKRRKRRDGARHHESHYFTTFRLNLVSLTIAVFSNCPVACTTMFCTAPGFTSLSTVSVSFTSSLPAGIFTSGALIPFTSFGSTSFTANSPA